MPTSTPDYAKLGLPSPTATPTLDYPGLASYYLTEHPTATLAFPTETPTATPVDPLSLVAPRKLPANQIPAPPPPMELASLQGGLSEPGWYWERVYIQAATDLMNYVNGDSGLYLQYAEAWTPPDRPSMMGEAWILRYDFDHDGQPEWLLSLPYYMDNKESPCCSQYLMLFERVDGLFRPVHYETEWTYDRVTKAIMVGDLKDDGALEVVLKSISCGTACGQLLEIGAWDGHNWRSDYIQSVTTDQVSFLDINGDGKTEIVLDYRTIYKLDTRYPQRAATDIYGWKNGQLVLLDEIREPTSNPYGIMRDVFSALSFGKTQQALNLAKPVVDHLDQGCGRLETYIGVEAMLAHGAQGDPQAMQSTLSNLVAYCNQPDNGFIKAANVLWQAYQQAHNAEAACEAMKRFMVDEIQTSWRSGTPSKFFDPTVMLPDDPYSNFCPLGEH